MISTDVARSISTITYPIRHRFAWVNPDINGRDNDLDTYGEANAHVLVTGLSERRLSTHNESHDYSTLVGRIVPVRPSRPAGGQWYLSSDDNGGNGAYVTGPRVSPPLVNGRVYQELRDIPGDQHSSPFYLRYNDDDHRDDRANANNPWTIVWAQQGLEHQVDRPRVTPPVAWVEMQWPLEPVTPVTTGLATDADIEEIFSEPIVPAVPAGHTPNESTDHTLGKGFVETDGEHAGHVILDPERVEGELYLTWYPARDYYNDHVFVQVAQAEGRLVPIGYFNRGVNGRVYYSDDVYTTPPTPGFGANQTMNWAKLALAETEVAPDVDARRDALIELAEASHESFEDLNDALNVLAREQSWCGEYERTMQGIGMRDRRSGARRPYDPDNVIPMQQRRAWNVEYTVDLTISDDSLSYRVSNMLESEYSVSSASNIRFDASTSVTVSVVADTEEEAENMVTQQMIIDELDGVIEGEWELEDYNHSDTNEDEDFDWDDYDG